jgi:hypothetical protein
MAVLAFWGVTSGFASDKKVFFLPLDGDQIGLTICNCQLPALARYPKGYFRFFSNLYFYRLLNARMRAVVLFVKK